MKEAIYNHLDYVRGFESFLNGMPAASLEAIRRSQEVKGETNSYQARIFDQLMDSCAESLRLSVFRRASPLPPTNE